MPSINILAQFSKKDFDDGIRFLQELKQKPIMTVEYFDKSWINQKRNQILLIILGIVVVVSKSLSWYFNWRSKNLRNGVRDTLLEVLGEENRDLLYLADEPDKLSALYECLKVTTELILSNLDWSSSDLDPWKLAVAACRKKLNL